MLDPGEHLAGLTVRSDAEARTRRYASTDDGDLLLDVYLPDEAARPGAGPIPAVVMVHGGAWRRGRAEHDPGHL